MRILSFLIACVLMGSCAPIPFYDTLAPRVRGSVVTSAGTPVARARVEYLFRGHRKLGETQTGPDGHFELGPFRQWFYLIYIGSPGTLPFPIRLGAGSAPDVLRVSHNSSSAIYMIGSQAKFDSRPATLVLSTGEIVQPPVNLPKIRRWTLEDMRLEIDSSMRDTVLPREAHPF